MNEKDNNNDSLIYPEAKQGKMQLNPKPGRRLMFILVVGLLTLVAAAILYSTLQQPSVVQEEPEDANMELMAEAQQKLDSIYASASIPETFKEPGKENFGLEEGSGGNQPSGTIVFTSRNTNITPQVTVYYLDLGSQQYFIPEYFKENNLFLFPEFNDVNEPTGAFLNTITNDSSRSVNSILGLHYYDIGTDSWRYLLSADGTTPAKRLELSPDGTLLAFARMKTPEVTFADMLEVEGWEIVIINTQTDEKIASIDGATHPEWSQDGSKLIFMRSNGLYLYDSETSEEVPIYNMEGEDQLISINMIDVSPNKEYLAITLGQSGIISMNRILDWDDFEIEEIGRITLPNTHVLWPQFSPDSQFYVVQAIDAPKEEGAERENPRFEIRSVLGREVVSSYPIDDFNFTEFHTDDWIASTTIPYTGAE